MVTNTLSEIATETELRRYAEVIIHCGLGQGKGIQVGDVVLVSYNQCSALLAPYLQAVITEAGGHLLHEASIEFEAGASPRDVLVQHGSPTQLAFHPLEHVEARYAQANHRLALKATAFDTPNPLLGTEADIARRKVTKQTTVLQRQFKQGHWKSYNLSYVPTEAMAKQSKVTVETFWQQIVKACFLDEVDPVAYMRASQAAAQTAAEQLTSYNIRSLYLRGENIDLHLELDESVRFISSQGGNIPSFECFSVPIAGATNGWVRFTYPFLYQKELIEDLHVRFEHGQILDWTASAGQHAFAAMLKQDGMDRLGEIAFTDRRLSRIDTILPGATMYLENIGGTGHIAFGSGKSIAKCFSDPKHTPGMNEANAHQDAVFSGDLTAIATLADGSKKEIFENGEFPFLEV